MKCLVSHNGPGGICLQRKVQHETHKCDYVSEHKDLYNINIFMMTRTQNTYSNSSIHAHERSLGELNNNITRNTRTGIVTPM